MRAVDAKGGAKFPPLYHDVVFTIQLCLFAVIRGILAPETLQLLMKRFPPLSSHAFFVLKGGHSLLKCRLLGKLLIGDTQC